MAPPAAPPAGSLRMRALNVLTKVNVVLYRVSGGRLGGKFDQAPVCVLHTVGRKSGQPRETPLLYLPDGEDVVLVASAGGRDTAPAWYHNLLAADTAEIEILGKRTRMRPRLAEGPERAALWPRVVDIYKDYAVYQTRTSREIPLVVMTPA